MSLAKMCQKGIVLHNGEHTYEGEIQTALRHYLTNIMCFDTLGAKLVTKNDISCSPRFYPTLVHVLQQVALFDAEGNPSASFCTGQDIVVRIDYKNATHQFPNFSIFIHNEYGERMATIDSTHTGIPLDIGKTGSVMCTIQDIRLGEGTYIMMLIYSSCTGLRETYNGIDNVPAAIRFEIKLCDFVRGVGHDAFQGAVHKSVWKVSKGEKR
jgi:lipopolysaccharide transport system ATP-binding protein